MRQQILVIDDSPPVHAVVGALLTDEPVDVHSAKNPELGLTLADSILPDLILLDVDMPGMDGFETCRQLKGNPNLANTPIVFLSAASSVEEKVRGLNLGAIDYITKPFSRPELLARVRACLRMSRGTRLLEQKAQIDFLTGLGNRAMFNQRFAAEVSLRSRTSSALSCILIDLDEFKQINDRYGHPFGDQVLSSVAETISTQCRGEDVACRFGGEEFIVLAPNTNAEDAGRLAERIRSAVANVVFNQAGKVFSVTCSLGVAEANDLYDRAIVERADQAMYQSKAAGRNRVTVADAKAGVALAA